jgi:hypothetical protein
VLRPYNLIFVLALVGLASAGMFLHDHATHRADRRDEAGPYLATLKAKLLAQPWPDDPQQIANIGAALTKATLDADGTRLRSIHANARMHALLGEAPQAHASVGDALQWLQQATAGRKGTRFGPEFELLWDRVLAKSLIFEPGTAEPTWPSWMPKDADPSRYHYDPAGAWIANKRVDYGALPIIFPLRVTNRSGMALAQIDGAVAFYYEEAQRAKMPRPGAMFRCPIAIGELVADASAVVACAFAFPGGEKDQLGSAQQVLDHVRSGRLKTYVEAQRSPDCPVWHLPNADRPALEDEFNEYHRLQETDALRTKRESDMDWLLLQWVYEVGFVTLGYALGGWLNVLGLRLRLLPSFGGFALAVVAVFAAAMIWGGSGYGPLAFAVVGLYVVGGIAIGLIFGRWLAPLNWRRGVPQKN